MKIDAPNQAWRADITCLRLEGGFVCLAAVMDWFSRKVLARELSNSLETAFCLSAPREAFESHGKPMVFNTDQGGRFTSEEWTGELKARGIRISMDGRGRAPDNVFVERLWRSLKYEEVYRREYADMAMPVAIRPTISTSTTNAVRTPPSGTTPPKKSTETRGERRRHEPYSPQSVLASSFCPNDGVHLNGVYINRLFFIRLPREALNALLAAEFTCIHFPYPISV